jgi:hypothetical protein
MEDKIFACGRKVNMIFRIKHYILRCLTPTTTRSQKNMLTSKSQLAYKGATANITNRAKFSEKLCPRLSRTHPHPKTTFRSEQAGTGGNRDKGLCFIQGRYLGA